jgi:hypothetical protein
VPRRFVAIGVAALATAGSGVGALLMAAVPAAAHASCTSDFQSRTQFNRSQNAPRVTYDPPNITVYEGNLLLLATNESQYTFLWVDCVAGAANPDGAL